MRKRNKILLYTILSLSILFNVITFSLDTYPFLYPKIKRKYFPEKTLSNIDQNTESLILSKSIEMAKSSKVAMVWNEPKGVTKEILLSRNITYTNEFRKNNYPRAFLNFGISEYLIKNNDSVNLQEFKGLFDKLIKDNGLPIFSINRVDQVPFGLVTLNLYREFGEEKYFTFSTEIYEYILSLMEEDGLIPYRQGQKIILNDMLGMTIPFLIEYSKIKNDPHPLEIAKNQLEYYIKYGVDKETFLPTHAIDRKTKVKIGPTNWGRGIGWYYIALAQYHQHTGEFKEEYDGLKETLLALRNPDNLWSQFPGGADTFDASATTMIMYSILLNNNTYFSKQVILEMLKPYISKEGEILHTSGDTYGLNNYSNTFGRSELSQGMLLLALSQIEN